MLKRKKIIQLDLHFPYGKNTINYLKFQKITGIIRKQEMAPNISLKLNGFLSNLTFYLSLKYLSKGGNLSLDFCKEFLRPWKHRKTDFC